MGHSSLVVGVDIGGSHIAAAVVDLEARSVLQDTFLRESINSHGSANEIITQWCSVIKKVFVHSDSDKKVGIAMPGPFGYQSGISLIKDQNKYDALYGLNIKSLLAESLQIRESDILFRNDAACFLQGEAFGGAAKRFKKAIGLTLGTGLGSAKYTNGVSEDADLWQSPFGDGIAEDYLSTRWFVKRCYQLTGMKVQNVKELIETTNVESLNKIFKEFGKNLALFLSDLILFEKPDVIVFGGNIANAYPLFYDELNNNLPTNDHPFCLKRAELGEQGSLIGAASCWYLS
jgi:glucokinase